MKAKVIGIGWVTAAGIGRGRRGDSFAMPEEALPPLSRKEIFPDPYPRFGRLDEFSRLGLSGIALALADAGLDRWEEKRNIGIVTGTSGGCIGTDISYFDTVLPEGGALASPNLFAYTLSNTFLGEAAIRFGLTGGNFVTNDSGPASFSALKLALESLAWGDSPMMLAGICDLSPPEGTETAGGGAPGTVFLTLSKHDAESGESHSEIALDCCGTISVNARVVESWSNLVHACLKAKK